MGSILFLSPLPPARSFQRCLHARPSVCQLPTRDVLHAPSPFVRRACIRAALDGGPVDNVTGPSPVASSSSPDLSSPEMTSPKSSDDYIGNGSDPAFTDASPTETHQSDVAPGLPDARLNVYFEETDSKYQPSLRPFFRQALRNFVVELGELLSSLRRLVGLEASVRSMPPDVFRFALSSEAVTNREREREFDVGEVDAAPFVRFVYRTFCLLLDVLYDGRPIQRFWMLETVARMPYFAYSSCLHLYATLGWYRSPTMMNMHHAEELNEAYHLAVMESLGGDKSWKDRFLAFHASLAYYWFLVFLFFISPSESYHFSELLEQHAVDTYAEFLEANEDVLKQLPAPDVAHEYYANFLYYFYEFQMSGQDGMGSVRPRPSINSLYDVFENILRDEEEHLKTMNACSGFAERGESMFYNGKQVSASSRGASGSPAKREAYWKNWSTRNNRDKPN